MSVGRQRRADSWAKFMVVKGSEVGLIEVNVSKERIPKDARGCVIRCWFSKFREIAVPIGDDRGRSKFVLRRCG